MAKKAHITVNVQGTTEVKKIASLFGRSVAILKEVKETFYPDEKEIYWTGSRIAEDITELLKETDVWLQESRKKVNMDWLEY